MKRKIYVMPYDKKKIMTYAHRFYLDGRMGDWSECLKRAWENARIIKASVEQIGEEAKTYGEWLALGYEIIHHQKNVGQCTVNSIRWDSKTTEILSFFTRKQICLKGSQPPKR